MVEVMGRKHPIISTEFASAYDLDIESLPEYASRNFITRDGALKRVKRNKAWGYKEHGRWYVVTKKGEDLKIIIT